MASPLEIFRLVAAEFTSVADGTVNEWLELTAPLVSRKRFGRVYNQALALLTAHRMKMAGADSGSEPVAGGNDLAQLASYKSAGVSSYSSGGESISFDNGALTSALSADAEYSQTVYGVQYVTLRDLHSIAIVNSGEGRC
jgi:hypothetical protein